MLQRREALGEDLIIYTHVDHITYDDVIKGLEKFAERKAAGNIIDCEYHDDVWNLTDQKRKYYFNFGYRKEEFRAVVKKHNIPYEKVVDHIKAFMIQLVGIRSLANLRLLLSALIDELIRSEYGFSDIKKIDIKNASIALYASVVPFVAWRFGCICKKCIVAIQCIRCVFKKNDYKKADHDG